MNLGNNLPIVPDCNIPGNQGIRHFFLQSANLSCLSKHLFGGPGLRSNSKPKAHGRSVRDN